MHSSGLRAAKMYVDAVEDEQEGRTESRALQLRLHSPVPGTSSGAPLAPTPNVALAGGDAASLDSQDAPDDASTDPDPAGPPRGPSERAEVGGTGGATYWSRLRQQGRLLLYHASVFFPLVILLTWFRPLVVELSPSSSPSVQPSPSPSTSTQPPTLEDNTSGEEGDGGGAGVPLSIVNLRVLLTMLWVCLRVATARPFLQAHLYLADRRVHTLRREAGTISAAQLRRLVCTPHWYLGVVLVHYWAPVLLIGALCLLYKTSADAPWVPPALVHRMQAALQAADNRGGISPQLQPTDTGGGLGPSNATNWWATWVSLLAARTEPASLEPWNATHSHTLPATWVQLLLGANATGLSSEAAGQQDSSATAGAAGLEEAGSAGGGGAEQALLALEWLLWAPRVLSRLVHQLGYVCAPGVCEAVLGWLLMWHLGAYSVFLLIGVAYHRLLAPTI